MKDDDKDTQYVRDLFAGMAMMGSMPTALEERWTVRHIAWAAYQIADEMLAVRAADKEKKE